MRFDSKDPILLQKAKQHFIKLVKAGAWIELKEMRMPRNVDANKLYWVWLSAIESEIGVDRNELHFQYRALFIPRKTDEYDHLLSPEAWKEIHKRIMNFEYFQEMHLIIEMISYSTTELDDGQFAQYLKKIQKHARVNFGVILLSLKDQKFKEFYEHYGWL